MRHLILMIVLLFPSWVSASNPTLIYLVSDIRIPFWQIMWSGIEYKSLQLGYQPLVLSAENDAKTELANAIEAINLKPAGIIVSPTNSSAAVTILKMAEQANIPVVISDIGTESGQYVSYIESDNYSGAYQLGKILARSLENKGWSNAQVGVIAIPQKRRNGIERTDGFLEAMKEEGLRVAAIFQQRDFSYQETYIYTQKLLNDFPEIRAIWLQGSDRYQAAIDAIDSLAKKGQVMLLCFDAEPEFVEMIRKQQLVGAGMQQPFLMGEKAVTAMHMHFEGMSVNKKQLIDVLAVSGTNLDQLLGTIKRNVLGQDEGD